MSHQQIKLLPDSVHANNVLGLFAIYSILWSALFIEIFYHFMGPTNSASYCIALWILRNDLSFSRIATVIASVSIRGCIWT
jgi:hypothetical protein